MFAPFFTVAAQSPSRQTTFRRAVFAHLLLLACAAWGTVRSGPGQPAILLGQVLMVAGIVEGATLLGWRLTQLPKSQALEFLLVSPLRPDWVFVGEALVGLTQLGLVTLAGLPILTLLAVDGYCDPFDLAPFLLLPFVWGAVTGIGLTVWAYEPRSVRRWGERFVFGLVVLYLVVGVLAGENLKLWLQFLPESLGRVLLGGFAAFHTHNPFGVMRHWQLEGLAAAWERALGISVVGAVAVLLLAARAAGRLQGHFHELHYSPARDVKKVKRPKVGDAPLTWWAVKRVAEYSGRINLWLAGGFGLLYALYVVAGPRWPAWMGRAVFVICDNAGGIAGVATGLVLLAAVPAAFQYGLWDSNAQDRCRRLELLLLTRLQGPDYWDAAAAAAWRRGRGYFGLALLLWAAAVIGGRMEPLQMAAAIASGTLLWGLYFALGFRAFARGTQANGLGMLLTVGLPLAAYGLARAGWSGLAGLLPPGATYQASVGGASEVWVIGTGLAGGLALLVTRQALVHCDAALRAWYSQHHGAKVMS
jgi:hypothetical protein